MRIFRKPEDLVDAIAREIAPDLDYKADSLECLTDEDVRVIFESASQHVESYQRGLNDYVAAERRAIVKDAENTPNDLPAVIRKRLAFDRERRTHQ